jgi:hypothetical protein
MHFWLLQIEYSPIIALKFAFSPKYVQTRYLITQKSNLGCKKSFITLHLHRRSAIIKNAIDRNASV